MKPKQNKVTRTLGKLRSRIAQVERMRDDLINGRRHLRNERGYFESDRDEVLASNLKLVQRVEELEGSIDSVMAENTDVYVRLGDEENANDRLRRDLYTACAEKHDARLALQQAQIAVQNAEIRLADVTTSRDLNRFLFWSLLTGWGLVGVAVHLGLL